jgi:hypothetical protein
LLAYYTKNLQHHNNLRYIVRQIFQFASGELGNFIFGSLYHILYKKAIGRHFILVKMPALAAG